MSFTKATSIASADGTAKRRFRSLKTISSPKALDCDEQVIASMASRKFRAEKELRNCMALPVALVVSIDEASDSEDGSKNALKHESISDTREQKEEHVSPPKAVETPEFSGQVIVGGVPLSWAVVKPSAGLHSCADAKPQERKPRQQLEKASNRTQSLRLKNADDLSTQRETISIIARLRERAQKLLFEALGSDEQCEEVSVAIVNAFLKVHEHSVARRLLLDLNSALRRNMQLKSEVIASGPLGVENLAHQDPREWATGELVAKRRRWTEESIQEIKPAAPAATCPVCGGRAVIATGTAGSGRSGRLTKAFAHYSCLEENCGKSSHVKQD